MTEDQPLENLNARVKTVWQRSQMLHFTNGLLAFFRWGIVLFLVAMLLDWLIDLPSLFRIALLLIIVSVATFQAWKNGWKKVRRFDASRAALQIEEHHGGLESLLVTAIQFRESKMAPGTSKSLQEVTCRKAEEAISDLQPQKVVLFGSLRRPLTIAAILAAVIVAFSIFNGPFLAAGLARIFPPWSAVAYPTRTQLEIDPQKIIVKEGNPAVIKADIKGVIPSNAKLALRTGTGEPRIHELEITDGQCEYTIKAAYRSFEYRITAGDAKSAWQEVEVISSPRIQQANVKLAYPAYTERPAETVEALTITVPEGTDIEWQLTLDRAVSEATFTPTGGKPTPLEVSANGLTVSMKTPATESRAYSFSWVEKDHGFSFTSPNHYLQVAPDQPPRVELTSPKNHLFATLGRKLDLTFRGRDDHGIGETQVAYRVNKIEEQKVTLPALKISDGGEQKIDWDYRKALPDLAIGDTVSFVVELADHYPGAEGPHRARSQARRITFLSEEDYLEQISKQKQRLLLKLRAIYREERKVHTTVSKLDPTSDAFIQSCQLEAIRQDLIRERIGALKQGMQDLIDDIAANNIKDESVSEILLSMCANLDRIAEQHVGVAATKLRELAAAAQKKSTTTPANAHEAIHSVDSAARELACLVLQVGFREATEVMARELHAVAESQAPMRLQTIMLEKNAQSDAESLAKSQEQLGQWLTRLFGALPRDKESTIEDALVAFNLSRLVKGLRQAEVEPRMKEAATLIQKPETGSTEKAAAIQADIIKALLYAEFRLRIGSEYEALDKARELFTSQVTGQQKLRTEIASLSPEQFQQHRDNLKQSQTELQKQLHLLLMPEIPAARPGLFDVDLPTKPPVEKLLATAESAMKKAALSIKAGDRDQTIASQQEAEKAFGSLASIVSQRIESLTERTLISNLAGIISKHASEIAEIEERQLNLIERTEDAENDKAAVDLARVQEKLALDIGKFRHRVEKWNSDQPTPNKEVLPLLDSISQLEAAMNKSTASLKAKDIDSSIEHQEVVIEILENTTKLLANQSIQIGSLAGTLNDTWIAMVPAPFVTDIQKEQLDLVKIVDKAKTEELPQLAIVQKNLIHAVNAVLGALDPLSHQIESGTVFLFAKDDMDAAAIAIEDNDLEEAADAGSFVAESLEGLAKKLAVVTPRYRYVLEIAEFYSQILTENELIRLQQKQLIDKLNTAKDAAAISALAEQQQSLEARAQSYARKLLKASGQDHHIASAKHMTSALEPLKAGNKEAAAQHMKQAVTTLKSESTRMTSFMEILVDVLKPSPTPEVSAEAAHTLEILALASEQKVLLRQTQKAEPGDAKLIAAEQLKLANRCTALVTSNESFAKQMIAAKLAAAVEEEEPVVSEEQLRQFFATNQAHLSKANQLIASTGNKLQSGNTKDAANDQLLAGEHLRYVVIAYIKELLSPLPPPSSSDPVPTDPTESLTDTMQIFMPGAVSGGRPKGGRQEWEVLGKRDRAALNENFARELPLEYRAILKDYYERLAE